MGDARTFIVTGANRGIGRATAEALARQGVAVVLACRDVAAGEDAEEAIRRVTGNTQLFVAELDLASLAAVRNGAADLLDRFPAIHGLINNAGVFTHDRRQSADGYELQFAVNHLGPFLLTHLLRDALVHGGPSRVITLSSTAHHRGSLDLAAVEDGGKQPYDGYQAYADSKLANVLFALALARRLRGTGVTSNAVHPGTVSTAMLADYLERPPADLSGTHLTPAEGARAAVHVATAPELADVTGRYFAQEREAQPARAARDETLAEALWAWSLVTTGAQESD